MSQELRPAEVCPPGQILLEELEARGLTQKDLATIIDRPIQTVNEIVKGVKQITPETALQLAEALETSPDLWLNLENNYRLYLARQQKDSDKGDQTISRRSLLYQLLPIQEMFRRFWIKPTNSTDELEQEVCKFLGITSLDDYPKQIGVNFRYTSSRKPEAKAQIAWVKRVQQLAKQQTVAKYDREALKTAIPELLNYSVEAEAVSRVIPFVADLGVRFVIVPHLPKTYIDGAAFYVDDQLDQPALALTLRYDRIDAFWFNLMHELAHIVSGHQGIILDNMEDGDINEQEREANQKARDWLIDPNAFEGFVQSAAPTFPKAKIERFADSQGRHPGIILGRVQREYKGYQYLRKLLVPIKTYLEDWIDVPTPNSLT
ncbi:MAG: HigA family addiction module antitoxin [Leptolyngbyaceae cyanobacterium bins.302]|nr:HigA family addiction module antitoxin [Leptolyngbyaceae cyanobacterium bins.302]